MNTATQTAADFRVFRFFISYAREDEKIAIAVSNAVQTALGPSAEVFIDKAVLRLASSFEDEIKKKLDATDALVVINLDGFLSRRTGSPAWSWATLSASWNARRTRIVRAESFQST